MALGPLPYKVTITQANPDIDQGRQIQLQVFDASSTLRGTFNFELQDPSLQQWADVLKLDVQMRGALISQMIADAGDVGTGLQALSLSMGG
jgi:hypothetical protein